ncbi:MAG: CpaF family protein [Betaproteobacteria bacterium]|nr:CpaF family protein [Betaproteobacteria bacterium]
MPMTTLPALRFKIHHQLLDQYDLARLQRLTPERQRAEVKSWVEARLASERAAINAAEHRQLVEDIQHEMLGLGPLEPLLQDPAVSDILVNGPDQIYVERSGCLSLENRKFEDAAHLVRTIERMVSRVGRRIDESSPMVDARLADGSRVNVIIPPLALDGPMLSIRRFAPIPLTLERLTCEGSLTQEMGERLQRYVEARLNILISGGTGSGKTTLLNVLSGFIAPRERLITIEDAAELRLRQSHVVRLETRPANLEGQGEITARQLVRNALRMRPDRLIVGEVRGAEAVDMLQAMNTGHDGSLTTLHANSPADALVRLENMVALGHGGLSEANIRAQISSALQVIVQTARLPDGSRRITAIAELCGRRGAGFRIRPQFRFVAHGYGSDGRIAGSFQAGAEPSAFASRLQGTSLCAEGLLS